MLDVLVVLGPVGSSAGKSGAVLERVASGDRWLVCEQFSAGTDLVVRGLCLIGYALLLGWEKALGGGDEPAWWQDRAFAARHHLVSG